MAAICARTGLPATSSLAKLPGNPLSVRRASRDSTRLVMPGARFCSCTSNGNPDIQAASPPGPEAKPPNPITARGRRRRSTARAALTALSRRNGAASRVSLPLPRTPATGSVSISIPCWGTSRVSIAPVAPSQTTGTPRPRSTCATASAGKMWPPVPPAITTTGRSC